MRGRATQRATADALARVGTAERPTAVIGAGVVGLSCALWLQRLGHSVALVDERFPESGGDFRHAASHGNACTIAMGACIPVATPGVLGRIPGMLLNRRSPLALHWRDLPGLLPWIASFIRSSHPAEVGRIVGVLGGLLRAAESGHRPLMEESQAQGLLRRNGCLYLYRSAAAFQAAQGEIALRRREGVAMSLLSPAEIREMEPGLAPLYHAGLRFDEAYALDDPARYAAALLRLFRQKGGQLVHGKATGLVTGAEEIGVHVAGRTLGCQQVVVAAGAWSRTLVRALGDDLQLNTERGYHVMFPQDGHRLTAPCCYPEHGFYMTPLTQGLRMAGTVELGGLGKPPRPERTRVIAEVARGLVPGLGPTGEEWLGFRPSMPDSLPVVGRSAASPRAIYAFGHGHIGLTLAGITGKLVAELASGVAPSLDLAPLSPLRRAAMASG